MVPSGPLPNWMELLGFSLGLSRFLRRNLGRPPVLDLLGKRGSSTVSGSFLGCIFGDCLGCLGEVRGSSRCQRGFIGRCGGVRPRPRIVGLPRLPLEPPLEAPIVGLPRAKRLAAGGVGRKLFGLPRMSCRGACSGLLRVPWSQLRPMPGFRFGLRWNVFPPGLPRGVNSLPVYCRAGEWLPLLWEKELLGEYPGLHEFVPWDDFPRGCVRCMP